jgi:S-disulfanyl-L-cysteine oxidoreductase SoxD
MSMRKRAFKAGAAAVALGASVALGAMAFAESPRLGKPITQADLAEWDINVFPDGTNLPPGSGKAADGAKIYAEKCVACHGESGQGGVAARLIGGPPKATLDGGKTIANYWPYATTVFDFIRRSMPWTQPRSLTDQEVYALTAYILAANKLIGEGDEMNATTLPKVLMPNRGNFVIRFPDRI